MTDPGALYRLMSWLSPSYPVGAFSYSHGLEAAVDAGEVTRASDLINWIETVMTHGTGRNDAILFRTSWKAAMKEDWAELERVNSLGFAFQPTAEIALEARAQGTAFLSATRNAWPAPIINALGEEACYPVAVGVCCAAHAIPMEDGLHGYLHAMTANFVSAGVRLIPLGQSDGQAALASLEPSIAKTVAITENAALDDLGGAAPVLDHFSLQHEIQYSRLFRS